MTRTTTTNGPTGRSTGRFVIFAAMFLVVAGLYFAREVLIPIALAILLSFLLAPLVRLLEKLKLPRAVSVIVAVVLAFGVIGGVGFVVYDQLADLVPRLPGYSQNVQQKVDRMRQPGGMLNWFSHVRSEARKLTAMPNHPASQPAEDKTRAATAPATAPVAAAAPPAPASPTTAAVAAVTDEPPANPGVPKVEVVNQPPNESPLDQAMSIAESVLGRAGTVFIVVIFTIFMLLQREDLRDKVIRLAGRDRLTTTTEALDDAAGRVSKYLLFQSMTNGTVGLIVMAGTWAIGRMAGTPFPSPALWGLLSALMRFIPYVGIWLSAVIPILLSFAVFGAIHWTLGLMGIYLVTELTMSNAVEPLLFGSSTGLASLSVLVAAAFWTWLWGPLGLLLSTPLTVVVVVIGKYVPALEFLNVLLSDEPALSAPDRVYQRLLALDQEEATDLVQEYAKKMPLEQVYDEVVLPALALAEADAGHGGLSAERHDAIRKSVLDLVNELGESAESGAKDKAEADQSDGNKTRVERAEATAVADGKGKLTVAPVDAHPKLPAGCVLNVVCLPAHDETDQVAATILGQLLKLRGYCVTVVSNDQLASEMVASVESAQPDAVVISAMPPAAVSHARYLRKRLADKVPNAEMIVGLWGAPGDLARARDRLGDDAHVRLAGSLRTAINQLHEILQPKLLNQTIATHKAG